MGSRPYRAWAIAVAAAAALAAGAPPAGAQQSQVPDASPGESPAALALARGEFRVCSDPNNLPYSNRREEGFENRIAELVAAELNARATYHWWPQRRGFIRNTLRQGLCDVVIGVPSSYELVLVTEPYYRSTYVFLYPKAKGYDVRSLDDTILRTLKIGVHTVGDDYTNSPPAHALGQRGIVQNVVGYSIYGDYNEENPPAEIVDAVGRGEVDMAIVWGPFAGYFAKRQPVELELVPVSPQIDLPFLPFVFDISMGVRRSDEWLKEKLDEILRRRRDDVRRILTEYGVPLLERPGRS